MTRAPSKTTSRAWSVALVAAGAAWLACSNRATGDAANDGARIDSGGSPGAREPLPLADAAAVTAANDAAPDNDRDGDAPVVGSPACIHYCDTVQTACNAEVPQFPTTDACLRACALYPPGTPTDPYEIADSLHCRQMHADASLATPLAHCHHAGPYGYGGCGSMCDAFCRVAMIWCGASAGGAPFASAAVCQTECESWAWATGADGISAYRATGPTSGDTLECREYQLIMSLESTENRDVYCPRSASISAPCQ